MKQNDERAAGPTFALDDIGWIDWESRSERSDLTKAGAVSYATEADAIVLAYAIGSGPVNTVKVTAFDGPLRWDDVPSAIKLHFDRVARGEAIWAAWNAGFDRAIWNFATIDFPEMPPEHIIDVMAQATASGLPPDLAKASEAIGKAVKEGSGKDLIKLFCTPAGLKGVCGTPQTHLDEWRAFDAYASGDIEAMRSVFRSTRQLTLAEWREYWAMEAINDRGVCIDVRMVREAADLAEEDQLRSRHALKRLTGGIVETVDQVAKMTAWLMARLPAEGRDILTKTVEEVDEETGEVTKPAKLQLTRKRIERLLAFCETRRGYPQAEPILQVLQIRRYGGSKTPAKFAKMLAQQVDGRLYGQYVFNGAPQTGRASSRGVQIHNLARDVLEHEPELLDALNGDGIDYDTFSRAGDETPVARKLSLLIRPAFVPAGDNVFVWSDWSQVEARIVPWLCDHMKGARDRVQIFRDVDADPSLPDIYTRTAATLSGLPIAEVTKAIRQRGKVTELACFAADTRVLTDHGVKPITDVKLTDKLWDGVEWVRHQGLVVRGSRSTINLDGVEVTAEHLIETNGTWRQAQQLATSAKLLSQALATGSASLSSLTTSSKPLAAVPMFSHSAPVGLNRTASRSTIFAKEHRHDAIAARRNSQATGARTTSATPILFLTTRIVDAFSIASRLVLLAARRQLAEASTTITTVVAAFASLQSGLRLRGAVANSARADGSFSPIWSRYPAGTIQSLRWTGSTPTAITSRATSASPLKAKVSSDPLTPCSFASTNSKPVYDIAHAGSRNRFTIMTNSGALIVHNCGFGGGVGALQQMAAAYGLHFTDAEARQVVDRWREANPWAIDYSREIWEAMRWAIKPENASQPVRAGRVWLKFEPNYLGGSLLARLPSGRCLTYRNMHWQDVDVLDEDDKPTGVKKLEMMFSRGYGRVKLWPGMFVENFTQATAADVLRGTLVRLEAERFCVRGSTHDEVIVECCEQDARRTGLKLRDMMRLGFDWSGGLPLMSEETLGFYYTKYPESTWGL